MIETHVFSVDDPDCNDKLLSTVLDEMPFPGDELMCRLGSLRVVRRAYLLGDNDGFVGAIMWVRIEKAMES